MRNNTVIIFLILLVALAFYFLGKKNGSTQARIEVVNNVAVIKEIAELGALNVSGNTNLKMTNRGDNDGLWKKFKNYFAENTLQVTIPFEAKFGIDMSNQKTKIDTKAGTVIIYLPKTKLLSLQLKLDQVDAISKTGILYSATIDEYIKAQKQLYGEALTQLEQNTNYQKLAEEHIKFILEKYYAPLGLKVQCVFGDSPPALL
ncbi:MAG: DUF4230 domain-containing protein [Ferruginibacter sp.]